MTATQKHGRTIALLAALCAAGFTRLDATSFYWDANGDTAGTGGAGTWDSTSALWRNGSSTGTLQAWPNTDPGNVDRAILAGTAGTVALNSLSQVINVNRITFSVSSYVIGAPSGGSAVIRLSGTTPTIDVAQYYQATIDPVVTGDTLTKMSLGMLGLRGNNTYAGGTYNVQGSLAVGHVNAFGPGTLYLNGGGLSAYTAHTAPITNSVVVNNNFGFGNNNFSGYGNSLTLSGPVSLTGSRVVTVTILGLALNGVISETGSGYGLTYTAGTGSGSNNSLTLGAANTFSGGVTFNGHANGTLRLGNMGALGTGTFTINGTGGKFDNVMAADGTLASNVAQVWNGDFAYVGTRSLNMGAGAVSLGTAAGTNRSVTVTAKTLTVGGGISDGTTAKYLTKAGVGALVLGGANVYSGATVVSAGHLVVTNAATLGTGHVRVANGATLFLRNSAAIGDQATLELVKVGTAYGKVNLAPGVKEDVGKVILGGFVYTQPGQTFGSTTSGANVPSNDYFAGTGLVRITSLPGTVVLIR